MRAPELQVLASYYAFTECEGADDNSWQVAPFLISGGIPASAVCIPHALTTWVLAISKADVDVYTGQFRGRRDPVSCLQHKSFFTQSHNGTCKAAAPDSPPSSLLSVVGLPPHSISASALRAASLEDHKLQYLCISASSRSSSQPSEQSFCQ